METTLDILDCPVVVPATPRARSVTQQMPPMAVLSLRGLAGSRVLVDAGRLWITESNDVADHFIGAGQVYCIKGAGQVVLQCDSAGGARYRLEDRHGKARAVSGF